MKSSFCLPKLLWKSIKEINCVSLERVPISFILSSYLKPPWNIINGTNRMDRKKIEISSEKNRDIMVVDYILLAPNQYLDWKLFGKSDVFLLWIKNFPIKIKIKIGYLPLKWQNCKYIQSDKQICKKQKIFEADAAPCVCLRLSTVYVGIILFYFF